MHAPDAPRDTATAATTPPLVRAILAASTAGAAAIHLAAGQAHVDALGDVGLGFYAAALLQAGLAVAFVRMGRRGPGPRLTAVAVLISGAITVAWLVSRTIGLPLVPGGAEPVGTADAVATALQLVTIATLVAVHRSAARHGAAWSDPRRRPMAGRALPAAALVAVLGLIALSSTIAVADAAAGHGHGPGAEHGHATDAGHGHEAAPAAETPNVPAATPEWAPIAPVVPGVSRPATPEPGPIEGPTPAPASHGHVDEAAPHGHADDEAEPHGH